MPTRESKEGWWLTETGRGATKADVSFFANRIPKQRKRVDNFMVELLQVEVCTLEQSSSSKKMMARREGENRKMTCFVGRGNVPSP